jgi:hypothetical protein
MIVCCTTLREKLQNFLKEIEVTSYTLVPEVTGSGQGGGTKLNTEVWPGINMMLFIQTTDQKSASIKEWIKKYKSQKVREGIKLFSLGMTEVI